MLRVAEHFERTDTGRQRRINEDAYFARAPLFVVADGMGGAQAGEVASSVAVEEFALALDADGAEGAEESLAARTRAANSRIYSLSRANADQAGMGTTLTALYAGPEEVAIAHVGDSRAYCLRDGELIRLTDDHSLVDELIKRGELRPEEAEEHPQRSVITRALGPEPTVEVDTRSFRARDGDVFLLCSDGLTAMVSEAGIAETLREHPRLGDAGRALVARANAAGGKDNVTVLLVRMEEVPSPVPGAERDGSGGSGAAPVPLEDDQPTLVGVTLPGLERLEVAAASSALLAGAGLVTEDAREPRSGDLDSRAAPRRRRLPRRQAPARARRRHLRRVIAPLVVAGAILGGGWIASQSVYFVGTNASGLVTIYQGLPFELPLGIRLYSTDYVSGVPAAGVPPTRRKTLLDNSLRSHDDAADLVRRLELGQLSP